METIANHYKLLLLVVDERSSQKFTRIAPHSVAPSRSCGSNGSNIAFAYSQATVLLHASQREHMNLICYDGRRISPVGQLPTELQRLWNLTVTPEGANTTIPLTISPRYAAVVSTKSTATGKRKEDWIEHGGHSSQGGMMAALAGGRGGRSGRSGRGGRSSCSIRSGRAGHGTGVTICSSSGVANGAKEMKLGCVVSVCTPTAAGPSTSSTASTAAPAPVAIRRSPRV